MLHTIYQTCPSYMSSILHLLIYISPIPSLPPLLDTDNHFLILYLCIVDFFFQIPHKSAIVKFLKIHLFLAFITQYMASRSIHDVAKGRISSFLWPNYFPLYMYTSFFTHLFINRHLDCFHILAIMNNSATHMEMQTSLQGGGFISFEYVLFSPYSQRLYTNTPPEA